MFIFIWGCFIYELEYYGNDVAIIISGRILDDGMSWFSFYGCCFYSYRLYYTIPWVTSIYAVELRAWLCGYESVYIFYIFGHVGGKWVGKPCIPWEGWVYMWCSDADYNLAMCVALHFCEECHGLHEGFFSLQLLVILVVDTATCDVVFTLPWVLQKQKGNFQPDRVTSVAASMPNNVYTSRSVTFLIITGSKQLSWVTYMQWSAV